MSVWCDFPEPTSPGSAPCSCARVTPWGADYSGIVKSLPGGAVVCSAGWFRFDVIHPCTGDVNSYYVPVGASFELWRLHTLDEDVNTGPGDIDPTERKFPLDVPATNKWGSLAQVKIDAFTQPDGSVQHVLGFFSKPVKWWDINAPGAVNDISLDLAPAPWSTLRGFGVDQTADFALLTIDFGHVYLAATGADCERAVINLQDQQVLDVHGGHIDHVSIVDDDPDIQLTFGLSPYQLELDSTRRGTHIGPACCIDIAPDEVIRRMCWEWNGASLVLHVWTDCLEFYRT